jgi:hypothetical protein
MPTKSANLGVLNHENVGENGIRCSSRISSNTSRHPSLVFPPSDSQRSISRQDPSVANHAGRKRNRNSSVLDTKSNKSKKIAKVIKYDKPKTIRKPCSIQAKKRGAIRIKTMKIQTTVIHNPSYIWLKTLMKPIPRFNQQNLRKTTTIRFWNSLANPFTQIMHQFVKYSPFHIPFNLSSCSLILFSF